MGNTTPAFERKDIEHIRVPFELDLKALDRTDPANFTFQGYASTYGNVDRGSDIMIAGCFDESLKSLRPDLRWQHKWDDVIGIFDEVRSDDLGLYVKGKMPKADSLVSGRVIPQMEVGSVRHMSIGFWAQEADYDDDGIRRIRKALLVEISLVSQAMNPKAVVTDMKKFDIGEVEKIKTRRDFEELLRESGAFSAKSAVYLASRFQEVPSESDEQIEAFIAALKTFATTIRM